MSTTCRRIIWLETLYKYCPLLRSTIIYSKLTMPTSGWDDWHDWFINIHSTKRRDILQTWKYTTHYNYCSIKDGHHKVTIVVSLETFDIILLFLRYLEYHLIGINMLTHVIFFMSTSAWFFSRRWNVDIITCWWQPSKIDYNLESGYSIFEERMQCRWDSNSLPYNIPF